MEVSLGLIVGWALRIFVVWIAYSMSETSFRKTGTPRRAGLRAFTWVLVVVAAGTFFAGYVSDEDCVSDFDSGECPGTFAPIGLGGRLHAAVLWLALAGVPVLVGALVGLRRREETVIELQAGIDLKWPEVRDFLKERVPEYVFALVFGGGALVVFFLAVMKYGGWGFLIGLAAMIPLAGAAVAVQVLLTLIRERNRPAPPSAE